jgi:transposase
LLLADDMQADPEHSFVARVLYEVPGLAPAITFARRLGQLLRRKSKEPLEDILDAATGTALAPFARVLRRDLGAVQAALDLPWTTSPAEGQVNRIKTIKRTMYGRAGFPLLRARVLAAA